MNNSWLDNSIRLQQRVMITAFLVLAVGFGSCGTVVGEQAQLLIALSAVALTGVSHGAVDHLVEGRFLCGKIGMVCLLILYMSLVAVVAGLWWVVPGASLLMFLCLSVIHFGSDLQKVSSRADRNQRLESLIRGSIPILIPCYTHPMEVTRYFNMLGCQIDAVSMVAITSQLMIVFWTAAAICLADECQSGNWHQRQDESCQSGVMQLAEHVALGAMCWVLPPLLSFAAYFCFMHSARHILRLAFLFDSKNLLSGLRQFARLSLPATAVSILGAGIIFLCTHSGLATAEVRTLFISLSALTVPHMFLAFLADVLGGSVLSNPTAVSFGVVDR